MAHGRELEAIISAAVFHAIETDLKLQVEQGFY